MPGNIRHEAYFFHLSQLLSWELHLLQGHESRVCRSDPLAIVLLKEQANSIFSPWVMIEDVTVFVKHFSELMHWFLNVHPLMICNAFAEQLLIMSALAFSGPF